MFSSCGLYLPSLTLPHLTPPSSPLFSLPLRFYRPSFTLPHMQLPSSPHLRSPPPLSPPRTSAAGQPARARPAAWRRRQQAGCASALPSALWASCLPCGGQPGGRGGEGRGVRGGGGGGGEEGVQDGVGGGTFRGTEAGNPLTLTQHGRLGIALQHPVPRLPLPLVFILGTEAGTPLTLTGAEQGEVDKQETPFVIPNVHPHAQSPASSPARPQSPVRSSLGPPA